MQIDKKVKRKFFSCELVLNKNAESWQNIFQTKTRWWSDDDFIQSLNYVRYTIITHHTPWSLRVQLKWKRLPWDEPLIQTQITGTPKKEASFNLSHKIIQCNLGSRLSCRPLSLRLTLMNNPPPYFSPFRALSGLVLMWLICSELLKVSSPSILWCNPPPHTPSFLNCSSPDTTQQKERRPEPGGREDSSSFYFVNFMDVFWPFILFYLNNVFPDHDSPTTNSLHPSPLLHKVEVEKQLWGG